MDDSLEKNMFSPIDNLSNAVFDGLLSDNARLDDNDIGELAGFLAFMATRVPRNIQVVQEGGSALASFMALELAKKPDEIGKALEHYKNREN